MVGSSGVDRRKGTDADDCGYGRRNSLYSNGGRAEGRTCGAGVAASATAYHKCGRQLDGRTPLVSFEGGAIACTGKQGGQR